MRPSAEELRQLWQMTKMPQEEVLFTPTYESAGRGVDGKPLCTAMVAMFTAEPGSFSDMHRLPTDEIWHFYLGDAIELLLLHPDGRDELIVLGTDVLGGQRVQSRCRVPRGWVRVCARAGNTGSTATPWLPGSCPATSNPGTRPNSPDAGHTGPN